MQNKGYVYPLSDSEQTAITFDNNISYIKEIHTQHGGYWGGEERTITHVDNKIVVKRNFINGWKDDRRRLYKNRTWSDFLKELQLLHIGEWESDYTDPHVLDGEQWSVMFRYNNGINPKIFGGSNRYPYNYKRYTEVMEIYYLR